MSATNLTMSTGIPGSFSSLKKMDSLPGSLQQPMAVELKGKVKVQRSRTSRAQRVRVAGVRNMAPEVVEMEPASQGSQLLVPRQKYCESIHKPVRRKTRTVSIGGVTVGSEHPIRVQTMTTTDTKDVKGTVEQVMRIADRGCDIVRITVQGKKEADACYEIKNTLVQKGYNIPLVADIHFAPSIAMKVADCFDKIRINPGNFADRRAQFEILEYTEADYQEELRHIEEVFTPLVEKCKKLGRAMRIGTNHGSLSDRIMSYYGDSPRGMVESAFEFARICRKHDYHNFLFSMKASNPVVMVQAYRLLVSEMYVNNWDYPLHLGVTEAGEGEDGRMKSAIGIGALLQDGLGDTIRVSLTEAPEEEIDPCTKLANLGMKISAEQKGAEFEEKHRRYFDFQRRTGQLPLQREGELVDYRNVLHRDGSVLMSVTLDQLKNPEVLYRDLATKLIIGMPYKDLATVDTILLNKLPEVADRASRLAVKRLTDVGIGVLTPLAEQLANPLPHAMALATLDEIISGAHENLPAGTRLAVTLRGDEPEEQLAKLKDLDLIMLLLYIPEGDEKSSRVHASRRLFEYLQTNDINFPVIHHLKFPANTHRDDLVIKSGSEAGAMLVDGLGDGVLLEAADLDFDFLRNTSFGMLQGCRMRNTKTEYVSCPSCGRTLFDLQDVSAEIREKTDHLPGVSIAIMGCIVNGPGEMADADFGYVGGAPGKIDLYVGKEVVRRGIAMEKATNELIGLIKEHGRWVDPEPSEV
uniref:4-hydroxy-3-methylbut-2-en-1-yl diphosphate synthase (ferredoxin), chloroplastic n=1 Tax=Physcomitrium patens TaxID=3218 RepID=A0A7I4BKD6_PHYPA